MDKTSTGDLLERIRSVDLDASDDGEAISASILKAAKQWSKERRMISMRGEEGAPDWLSFEVELWQLGESLRRILIQRKDLRKSPVLVASIAAIVENRSLGKGRQPYLELLAKYGGPEAREVLVQCLDQPDLAGQAARAVTLAKLPLLHEKISRLLDSQYPAWVRREARKYLKRFGHPEE